MVLVEGDLQITVPKHATGRKFDDGASHGLSHCMKAVDFIIEFADKIYFIEFKDPDNPKSRRESSDAFIDKLKNGQLDAELKTKYRDSWLYEWARGGTSKPVVYLVLIAVSTLSAPDLLTRTDALKRQLPMIGPEVRPWTQAFVSACLVMNLAAWNKALPDLPIVRVSRVKHQSNP